MTNLKKNIDHYMEIKDIKTYVHLLHKIGYELGMKDPEAYNFAIREKANFSKMLKGERPLKHEFVIPLENIFGLSLCRLMDEDAYKMPLDKELIPFVKGFRYYAYMDNTDLYESELSKLLNKDGKSILYETDEFGKTFLDYVVEYNAVNGVRFLHDFYKLKLRFWNNQFETEPNGMFWIHDKALEFCRLVANMEDLKLFNDIFDSYYTFVSNSYYLPQTLYAQDDFFEIVMDHKHLFDDLFDIKTYKFEFGAIRKKRQGKDYMAFSSINPVINGCLNYALKHLDKYKEQAIGILKFGIEHNKRVKEGLPKDQAPYRIDEIGGLRKYKTDDVVDVIIKVDVKDIQDKGINSLVEKLPIFDDIYWSK